MNDDRVEIHLFVELILNTSYENLDQRAEN